MLRQKYYHTDFILIAPIIGTKAPKIMQEKYFLLVTENPY